MVSQSGDAMVIYFNNIDALLAYLQRPIDTAELRRNIEAMWPW
jgi:hypothetical protein